MAEIEFHQALDNLREENGLIRKVPCSKQQNKLYKKLANQGDALPEGVYTYPESDDFYTISKSDFNKDELVEYLWYKQIGLLRSIKNCAVFFVILTVIGIIAAVLLTTIYFGK